MSSLAHSLDSLINEQLSDGTVNSESEAEQLILEAVAARTLDRKLATAEKQIENKQYKELNQQFTASFIKRAKARHSS